MENKVKFYSEDDLSIPFYFKRMEKVFSLYFDSTKKIDNFSDAIELKNAVKIFESGSYSIDWTEEYIARLNSSLDSLKKTYYEFLGRVTFKEISEYMFILRDEYEYREDFFEIFSKFKYGSRIPEEDFSQLFWETGLSIHYLLKDDYFYKVYPNFVKEAFLSQSTNLEYLLSNYTDSNYFIPLNITKDEWNLLLEDYIHDRNSNLNYLRLLLHPIKGLGDKYFQITDVQKLAIQKISDAFNESFDKTDAGLRVIFEIYLDRAIFKQKQEEYLRENPLEPMEIIDKSIVYNLRRSAGEIIDEQLTLHMISLVDRELLTQYKDSENLFKNLILDTQLFSNKNMVLLPSFPNKEALGVARVIGVYTKNSYPITQYFQIKQQQICYKIMAYQKILSEFDSSIEQIIHWYFFDFLNNQGIKWLPFSFSPKDDVIDNRISTIFKNEEKIRKQYKQLVDYGEIEKDLYNLTRSTPGLETLPSYIAKKYAYLTENKLIHSILPLLFSDQSHLTYVDEIRTEKCFVELIEKHFLRKEDFLNHQQVKIQFLIDNNIISADEQKLQFVDKKQIDIFREFYWYGEVNYYNSDSTEKLILDALYEKGMISFGQTLFSKSESNYLNFIMNNSKFDNSWGIRNKYQHGSPAYDSEEQYYFDSSISLLILIIYASKINEEIIYKKNTIKGKQT